MGIIKNKISLKLTKKEVKLLVLLLEDLEIEREGCTSNDPVEQEEKLFTKKERKEMCRQLEKDKHATKKAFLFNCEYPKLLRKKIKRQL